MNNEEIKNWALQYEFKYLELEKPHAKGYCQVSINTLDRMLDKAREDKEKDIVERLKEANPYSPKVFIEPTKKEWKEIHKALNKIRNRKRLYSDGIFGSVSRVAWDNAVRHLDLILKGER